MTDKFESKYDDSYHTKVYIAHAGVHQLKQLDTIFAFMNAAGSQGTYRKIYIDYDGDGDARMILCNKDDKPLDMGDVDNLEIPTAYMNYAAKEEKPVAELVPDKDDYGRVHLRVSFG